jgi:hypothetical protein
MAALIDKVRAPHKAKLEEKLAVSEGLLYRRGNFNGSWDQLILDAIMEVQGADIGFSPGFRWGTTILPGQAITFEHLMDQTAITYPQATLTEMSGEQIKTILEDVGDNLFNPDPYYQQGGDMVRVGGLEYTCDPNAEDRQAHPGHAPQGQADRSRQDLQGCRLGAGGRRRQGRAGVGRGGALPARQEDHRAAQAQPAQAHRHEGQRRHRLTFRYKPGRGGREWIV